MSDFVYSTSVAALDSVPVQHPDTGQGAPGEGQFINDTVHATTGGLGSTSSVYDVIRLPSTCKLKSLVVSNDTLMDTGGLAAALVLYVGAMYSDAPASTKIDGSTAKQAVVDGTPPSDAGVIIAKEAFGSIANPAANTRTEMIPNANASAWGSGAGDNVLNAKNEPLWQALALAADPGGYIDVCIYVHTAANTAAADNIDVEARFVM